MLIRTREDALAFRAQIAKVASTADDAIASEAVDLYPTFTYDGSLIKNKTRKRFSGKLYIAQYDTYDRVDTDPEHDANGWAVLSYHSGYRDIPETMTTSTMFMKDEIGWYQEKFYKSLIDNNSWTPIAYSQGWQEITI